LLNRKVSRKNPEAANEIAKHYKKYNEKHELFALVTNFEEEIKFVEHITFVLHDFHKPN
jgi:hypothetical protein